MKCQKCNKQEATQNWIGEGSMMDVVHGNYQRWCKGCCLKEQIAHKEKQLKKLPKELEKLKKELSEL